MQIAGIFLLPNGTFFVELLIVFVLLYITSKFILPPLTKAMDERDADSPHLHRGRRVGQRRRRRGR